MKYLPDMEEFWKATSWDQVLSAAEQYDPDMFYGGRCQNGSGT